MDLLQIHWGQFLMPFLDMQACCSSGAKDLCVRPGHPGADWHNRDPLKSSSKLIFLMCQLYTFKDPYTRDLPLCP